MPMTLDRSREQRLDALYIANEVRSFRAAKKKEIHDGREAGDFFLRHGAYHPMLQSMKVRDALLAMPGVGVTKVNDILRRAGVGASRQLGGLTPGQWARLYAVIARFPVAAKHLSAPDGNVKP